MADKKITLSIAGQEVVCNFGVNYFYKHFKEISGKDMLVEGLKGIETTQMFDIIHDLYYAGYRAECSVKREEPKLTGDDFEHFVLSSNEAGAGKLITDYLNTIKPPDDELPGEHPAQTISP